MKESLYISFNYLAILVKDKQKIIIIIIIPSIILTLHPLVQSRIRTLRRPRLARQKSLILTAQITRPLQKKLSRGEL